MYSYKYYILNPVPFRDSRLSTPDSENSPRHSLFVSPPDMTHHATRDDLVSSVSLLHDAEHL